VKRTELERRTPLSRSSSGLDRSGSGLTTRSAPRSSPLKRGGFTPASAEQKAKAKREGSRVLVDPQFYDAPIDAAHVVSRGLGGCDHEDCICPLPRHIHTAYDSGEFDLLPHLSLTEQAHAVSHLGILGALKRTTGETYTPQSEGDQS
jgi:hypothetical protein